MSPSSRRGAIDDLVASGGLGAREAALHENDAFDESTRRAVVFCVGNRLMLDEGVGPAVYDAVLRDYDVPSNVRFFDVGCISMDMLNYVDEYDVVLTVDAVDGTGDEPGRLPFPARCDGAPYGAMQSLHDLKLVDLFDAASLLGYVAEGFCLGMQIENMMPDEYVVGLYAEGARSASSSCRDGGGGA